MNRLIPLFLLFTLCFSAMPDSARAQKKRLGQEDFPGWRQLMRIKISPDGRWVSYGLKPAVGDSLAVLYDTRKGTSDTLFRADSVVVFGTGKKQWIAYSVKPTYAQLREARVKKLKRDQMPPDTMYVRSLTDGSGFVVPKIKSIQSSAHSDVLAYRYEVTPAADTTDKKAPRPKKFDRLVVWNTAKGDSVTVDNVESFQVSRDGKLVIYSTKKDSLISVRVLRDGVSHELYTASQGKTGSLALDRDGSQGAYLVTPDTTSTGARYELFWFSANDFRPVRVAGEGARNGYTVSEFGRPAFSRDGSRLEFGMAPQPRVTPKDTLPEDEKFSLDIWSYTDTLLMTQQLVQARRLRTQNFKAAWYPATQQWVLLGDKSLSRITFAEQTDAPYAIGTDEQPYQWASTWESSGKKDVYRVDVRTGERKLLAEGVAGNAYLSPKGDYAAWYDYETNQWHSIALATGEKITLSNGIPYQLFVQGHDTPNPARPEGFGGWTTTGKAVIYDNFDLWLTDPAGKSAPVNLTRGEGRRDSIAFKVVSLDKETRTIDLTKPLVLSVFNKGTKDGGYYRLSPNKAPEKLVMDGHRYTFVAKAESSDNLIFQRENFTEYRDIWLTDLKMKDIKRVSTANPQAKEYMWGSVERINWATDEGDPAEGLLYLPEDYDSSRRYPVIVYFYDTHTNDLHKHVHPQPSWSIVVPAVCTSQDYIVFMPDIHYTTGWPGESCYKYVVSGSKALIERGIADPQRMALQGQSWGGYQIAYLVTRTDMFVCASPGAPVSNMTSAFGGIRWGSGMPRMFQYEQGQSRIGASLWEDREAYIRNSPLFFADKVTTPVLMRHDDADEAVPWYQGIEYFLALRRFGVPVWMLNYNNQPHNLRRWADKMDWDKRLQQFHDHYLKGAPMPRWMREGLPVTDKGIDQRYDY